MACTLTNGRIINCKDDIGGLKSVYFIDYGDLGAITYETDGDTIASIAGEQHAFKYDLKGSASSFTQTIVSSRDAGTTVFEQALELTLPNLSITDNKELKLIAYGNPHVIVEDNNGNAFLMGTKFGADVEGGTIVTGGAMTDMSGYTLSLKGMEPKPANFFTDLLDGAAGAAALEAIFATTMNLIIVKGDGTFVS